MRNFAWSYSALTSFETCPKQYWHYRIKRDVKEGKSQATDYGSEVHKHFENRLIKKKPLPLDLRHHEKVLSKLEAAPGEGMPEQKLAINRAYQPTGFFDDDVWCRSIIDYTKVITNRAIIVDHKTGKVKEGFDQVDHQAAMLFCYMPEIEQITAGYYWTKAKRLPTIKITREDVPAIWNKFMPRVEHMENQIKHDEFPAKPNGLCKRYCAVTSCPHHGG